MSAIDEVRTAVSKYLKIDPPPTVVGKVGADINVGENFTLAISVRNTDTSVGFKNVTLMISGTANATPSNTSVTYGDLGPGLSISRNVLFKANKTLDKTKWVIDPPPPVTKPHQEYVIVMEQVAVLQAHGDADIGLVQDIIAARSASVDIRA